MALGHTYIFLFRYVSNSRIPFLRLLVSKGHFQVIVNVPVSAEMEDLPRKFCYLR